MQRLGGKLGLSPQPQLSSITKTAGSSSEPLNTTEKHNVQVPRSVPYLDRPVGVGLNHVVSTLFDFGFHGKLLLQCSQSERQR